MNLIESIKLGYKTGIWQNKSITRLMEVYGANFFLHTGVFKIVFNINGLRNKFNKLIKFNKMLNYLIKLITILSEVHNW